MSRLLRLLGMAPPVVVEEITYPRMIVTADNPDACKQTSWPYQHLLTCGHLIHTAKPDEPCGNNCYHVATSKSDPCGYLGAKKRSGFTCQACTEEQLARSGNSSSFVGMIRIVACIGRD